MAPANANDRTMGSVGYRQLFARNLCFPVVDSCRSDPSNAGVEETGPWRVLDTVADAAEKKEEGSGRTRQLWAARVED
jgi:hypothetical protein